MNVLVSDDPLRSIGSNQVVITSEQNRQVNAWVLVIQRLLDDERNQQNAVRWIYANEMRSLSDLPIPDWRLRLVICARIRDNDFVVAEHSFDFRGSDPEDGYLIICRRPPPPAEQPQVTYSCSRSSYPPRFGH